MYVENTVDNSKLRQNFSEYSSVRAETPRFFDTKTTCFWWNSFFISVDAFLALNFILLKLLRAEGRVPSHPQSPSLL